METAKSAAGLIEEAYNKLKISDAVAAAGILEQALKIDFDNEELKHALKCVHWWLEQFKRVEVIQDPFEKGGFLLSLLKQYYVFLENFNKVYDRCQYAIRCYVFSTALIFFDNLLGDGANKHDPGLLLLIGRCYKGLGNYDEAIKYLEQAIRFKREDAEALAELADINAMMAETKAAKALFREAFFLDPTKVDLRSLESELILRLRDKVAALGYREEELCEWIPVYGYLWGVFSIKRELKQVEIGRLKQSIFSLEAERMANPKRRDEITPRLLNRYFWLIDHYENSRSDPALIEECLLKIKVTDPDIYQRYTR
ncbi:MAG: tetratricopeptide repeat protein [Treponema sp.]|nr:tetratricopeptide repeat protein [Treponema sp.]